MRLIAIEASGVPAGNDVALSGNARDVCMTTAALYGRVGFEPPWIGYLAEVDGQLIGTCAFTAPARAGRVEIAYFTFPQYEGRGLATQMARALLAMAREQEPGVLVTAQTLPQENASTSILRRLDFRLAGTVEHPEDGSVWEWHHQVSSGSPD